MRIETERLTADLDEVARASRFATFYQTSAWLSSIAATYPALQVRALVARDGDICGYLPFVDIRFGRASRLWSLPFGTYGGAVIASARTDADEIEEHLVDRFLQMRARRDVHEVGIVDFNDSLPSAGLVMHCDSTHIIDLRDGFDAIWSNGFDKAKRRQTRKAEREGVRVREAVSSDEVNAYYQIYAERSDLWGQRLRYPESLFQHMFRHGRDTVRLFLAYDADRLLGGHFNLYYKENVIAWNGVTTHGSRGMQASTMLYAHAIRDACEHGFHSYNLGSSLGKSSLAQYKTAIGGVVRAYRTLRWRSLGGRIASVVMKVLPRR